MKATIYRLGGFGTSKVEVRLESITAIDWAQYVQVPSVIYIEKGKRTRMQIRASEKHPKWLIVEGWDRQDPPGAFTDKEIADTGLIVSRSRFSSFAPEYAAEFETFADKVAASAKVIFDGRKDTVRCTA